jgi:hypothetical protein
MDLKRGFKVFQNTGGILRSAAPAKCKNGAKIYRIGCEERPNEGCGPMTVFRDEKAAKIFAEGMQHAFCAKNEFQIRKVTYRQSDSSCVWYSSCRKVSLNNLIDKNSHLGMSEKSCTLASMIIVLGE